MTDSDYSAEGFLQAVEGARLAPPTTWIEQTKTWINTQDWPLLSAIREFFAPFEYMVKPALFAVVLYFVLRWVMRKSYETAEIRYRHLIREARREWDNTSGEPRFTGIFTGGKSGKSRRRRDR